MAFSANNTQFARKGQKLINDRSFSSSSSGIGTCSICDTISWNQNNATGISNEKRSGEVKGHHNGGESRRLNSYPDDDEKPEEEEVEEIDDYIDDLDDDSIYDDKSFMFDIDSSVTFTKDPNDTSATKRQTADWSNYDVQSTSTNNDDDELTFEITLPLRIQKIDNQNNDDNPGYCKSSEKLSPNLQHYERICTLGVGTFGRVSLVKHREISTYFALKTMPIKSVIDSCQVDHAHSEKMILESLSHPFITQLHWTTHDDTFLYMLFDYMPGGELFSYLRTEGHFSNETTRFYAAEILLALQYLHSKNIVYRDLKPENLLLDAQGHVVLIDFGFSKILREGRTWTMCGTAEYVAPEIIECRGHNKAVDFWAFGVLLYEMLIGKPPFRGDTTAQTYQKILSGRLKFPRRFYKNAKDLIKSLLVVDRAKRLGNSKGQADEVKNHKWFRHVDWDDVYHRRLQPPIIPRIHYEGDSGNFDEYDESETFDPSTQNQPAERWELELFKNW